MTVTDMGGMGGRWHGRNGRHGRYGWDGWHGNGYVATSWGQFVIGPVIWADFKSAPRTNNINPVTRCPHEQRKRAEPEDSSSG